LEDEEGFEFKSEVSKEPHLVDIYIHKNTVKVLKVVK